MNDDHSQRDHEQLTLATARSLPTNAELTAETAALRERFLTIGGALDAASGQVDEASLLAGLQPLAAPVVVAPTRRRSDATWQAALSVALAAAALIAVVRIAAPLTVTSPAGQPLIAWQEPAQPAAGERPAPALVQSPALATRGGWLDPLDAEIALAQAEFQQLNASDRGVDGSLSRMNERLEALSQELFHGSL